MRFVADENVSRLVIDRLRSDGHDVISIAETRSVALDEDVLNSIGQFLSKKQSAAGDE
jgi:hypothetical protein